MTVRELIAVLDNADLDAEVYGWSYEVEGGAPVKEAYIDGDGDLMIITKEI